MRFFQSESHSKPDDNDDDTVRAEPVPAQRGSSENDDDGDHRTPETADSPHVSGGRADADADGTPDSAEDAPHISTGRTDDDADRDGLPDEDADRDGVPDAAEDSPHISVGRTDTEDSSERTGEPVDVDVVPEPRGDEEPVFVEPAPQETAFGAATVGGAVAASEVAARREVDDETAVGTASVPPATATDTGGSPSDLDRDGVITSSAGFGADESEEKPLRAEGLGDAPERTEGFGDRPEPAEGFGDRPESAEGFGDADDKPLRAEDAEEHGSSAAGTAALGVAAGAAAGAAAAGVAAKKDRDRDGQIDSEPVTANGEPVSADATAAVPIEPIPAPADALESPATTDEPVELLPGDVPEQPALAAFFSTEKAGDFRDRWREVQLRFVDDPAQAATDAGALIDEVVSALNAAVTEQRRALGGTPSGQGDTEQLRVLVRRQRDFLDRILGL